MRWVFTTLGNAVNLHEAKSISTMFNVSSKKYEVIIDGRIYERYATPEEAKKCIQRLVVASEMPSNVEARAYLEAFNG